MLSNSHLSATVERDLAQPPYILALDIGSSALRAILFDSLGRNIDGVGARLDYQLNTSPPGASEADPQWMVSQLCSCIDDCLQRAGKLANGIKGVAATSLVNNILGIDIDGDVVVPMTTYADTRSTDMVADLKAEFDEREVHDRTGCRFHPSYLPARLRWYAHADPQALNRVSCWISLGEYLEQVLFGASAVSYSVASWTGLLDRRELQWDPSLLAGLPISEDQLGELTDAGRPRRGLNAAYAERWPALVEVPWFPAIGDGAAANIGSGCWSADRIALTIGTTSAMRAVVEDTPDLPSGLWCYRVDGRRALPGGALTEGGMVYAWMRDTLRLTASEMLESQLDMMKPDQHGLTVLPFFAGERSPGWAGDAVATVHGMTLSTQPIDILRAGMEAVAYRIALVYKQIRALLPGDPQIVASGGALLSSPVWQQIMADVLGLPLAVSEAKETTARGAALLTLEALGAVSSVEQMPALIGRIIEPNPSGYERYQEAIERQQMLYATLSKTW